MPYAPATFDQLAAGLADDACRHCRQRAAAHRSDACPPVLFSDLNGGTYCPRHMGGYAQAALDANGAVRRITTPITVWKRMTDADIADLTAWLADAGIDFAGCESCLVAETRAAGLASVEDVTRVAISDLKPGDRVVRPHHDEVVTVALVRPRTPRARKYLTVEWTEGESWSAEGSYLVTRAEPDDAGCWFDGQGCCTIHPHLDNDLPEESNR